MLLTGDGKLFFFFLLLRGLFLLLFLFLIGCRAACLDFFLFFIYIFIFFPTLLSWSKQETFWWLTLCILGHRFFSTHWVLLPVSFSHQNSFAPADYGLIFERVADDFLGSVMPTYKPSNLFMCFDLHIMYIGFFVAYLLSLLPFPVLLAVRSWSAHNWLIDWIISGTTL